MHVGFIGFGEAGFTIGKGLRAAGLERLFAYDIAWQSGDQGALIRRRAEEAGATLVASPSELAAAATVLLRHFNDRQTFTLTTVGQPSRTYTSISQARADGNNARIWGGMHYPSTVAISDALGEAIARYVDRHSMTRLRGRDRSELR